MEKWLLVGSGAREHAISKALTKNNDILLYSAMELPNPGIKKLSQDVLSTETEHEDIIQFCMKNDIHYCVVGPEKPLNEGLVDKLESNGILCASPSQEAAKIETNKTFMRNLLDKYNIPGQIKFCSTNDKDIAVSFASELNWQVAVKPIGLTKGKGVKVWGDHLQTPEDVKKYIYEILELSVSGFNQVVVEELLQGQEYTLHFYCDGTNVIPLPLIQDHKRAFNNDKGPNTGGMGAYTCNDGLLPFVTEGEYKKSVEIGKEVIQALKKEGALFKGILYAQFMITATGPKIIEFNARFGDPEAINMLALLETPFTDVCKAMINGELNELDIVHRKSASVMVYVVPEGYGTEPHEGDNICLNEEKIRNENAHIYYASCLPLKTIDGLIEIQTTKARTIGIFSEANTTEQALQNVLSAISTIKGNFCYRTDIGSSEILQKKVMQMDAIRLNSNI